MHLQSLERRTLLSNATGFGDDDWAELRLPDPTSAAPEASIRQPDGKVLALLWTGDFGLVRFNVDGTLDRTFGDRGMVFTDFLGGGDMPSGLALMPDGRIVVAGAAGGIRGTPFQGIGIARYNPDGSLDTSFDEDGMLTSFEPGQPQLVFGTGAVRVDAQGRIYTGGYGPIDPAPAGGKPPRAAVVRYNADGSLDTTFGNGGQTELGPDLGGHVNDLLVLPDGDLLVAAEKSTIDPSTNSAVSAGLYLTRLNADGSVDTTFGDHGEAFTSAPLDSAMHIVVTGNDNDPQDGRIILAGMNRLARFHLDGTPDTSFGKNGLVPLGSESFPFVVMSVESRPDGKILVGGSVFRPDDVGPDGRPRSTRADAVMFRLQGDGSPDPTFGDGGQVTLHFGRYVNLRTASVDPHGNVVAVGTVSRGELETARINTLFLARWDPDGQGEPRPTDDPPAVTPYPGPQPPPYTPGPFTTTVGGFTINYTESTLDLPGEPPQVSGFLTLTGGAGDDLVRVRRNPTLPMAIDFELNGETFTFNLVRRPEDLNWEMNAGDGDDRVEIHFSSADQGSGMSNYRVYGAAGNDVLINGNASGFLHGGSGDDVLVGGDDTDYLIGDDGIDQLFGNAGDDELGTGSVFDANYETQYAQPVGREAGEVYVGGPGEDRLVERGQITPLVDPDPAPQPPPGATLGEGASGPLPAAPPGWRVDYSVRPWGGAVLWLYGPDSDDTVYVRRSDSVDRGITFDVNGTPFKVDLSLLSPDVTWGLSAGGGNDRVEVYFTAADARAGSAFSYFQILGGSGNDELMNGDTPAVLYGGDGDDVLVGGEADDNLRGESGVDRLYGQGGDDVLYTGFLHSTVLKVEDGEVYGGGAGDDILFTDRARPLPDVDPEPQPPIQKTLSPEDVGGSAPEPDPAAMTARFTGRQMVRAGRAYTFTVTYTAPAGGKVDRAAADRLVVTGPGGFAERARLVGAKPVRKGAALVARYRVDAPGGAFDPADNGIYVVRTRAGATRARSLSTAAITLGQSTADDLGTFTVEAKERRTRRGH